MRRKWASVPVMYVPNDASVKVSSHNVHFLSARVLCDCAESRVYVCEVVKFYEDVFDGRVGSVVVGVVVQADVGCDQLTTWVVCD